MLLLNDDYFAGASKEEGVTTESLIATLHQSVVAAKEDSARKAARSDALLVETRAELTREAAILETKHRHAAERHAAEVHSLESSIAAATQAAAARVASHDAEAMLSTTRLETKIHQRDAQIIRLAAELEQMEEMKMSGVQSECSSAAVPASSSHYATAVADASPPPPPSSPPPPVTVVDLKMMLDSVATLTPSTATTPSSTSLQRQLRRSR